jgi:hypothetical protein
MPYLGDYESLIDCIVFLYPSYDDALHCTNMGGTGFLVQLPFEAPLEKTYGHHYIVSNWHVAVTGGASVVRINRIDGGVDIFEYEPHDWFFIPGKHDVAVLPITAKLYARRH